VRILPTCQENQGCVVGHTCPSTERVSGADLKKRSYKELVGEGGGAKSIIRQGEAIIDAATLGPRVGKRMRVAEGRHRGLECIVQAIDPAGNEGTPCATALPQSSSTNAAPHSSGTTAVPHCHGAAALCSVAPPLCHTAPPQSAGAVPQSRGDTALPQERVMVVGGRVKLQGVAVEAMAVELCALHTQAVLRGEAESARACAGCVAMRLLPRP
jgi:hypothetical protein